MAFLVFSGGLFPIIFIMLKGKHIILGISGSIAAYKAATLIRLLVKEGAEVKVVMTPVSYTHLDVYKRQDLIALHPTPNRDECRLMVLDKKTGKIEHKIFRDIIDYFEEKDVFVFNDTKVFPARLYGNKEKTGAEIEVFLLRELNKDLRIWDVLVDPARKIRIGNKLYFGEDDSLVAEVIDNTTSPVSYTHLGVVGSGRWE